MLPDPIAVIKDIRQLVLDHKDDNKELAITGKYILRWNESDDVDNIKKPRKHVPKVMGGSGEPRSKKTSVANPNPSENNPNPISTLQPNLPTQPCMEAPMTTTPTKMKTTPSVPGALTDNKSPTSKKIASGNRRRRVRCKTCEACMGGDCKLCVYCKDMTKYGGPGRMKQTCEKRRCLHPQLPVCAYCSECKWF